MDWIVTKRIQTAISHDLIGHSLFHCPFRFTGVPEMPVHTLGN